MKRKKVKHRSKELKPLNIDLGSSFFDEWRGIETNPKEKDLKEKKTGKPCVVCRCEIVETFLMKFDSRHGPLIIGPGSRNQFSRVSNGLHCSGCGIKYAKLPE